MTKIKHQVSISNTASLLKMNRYNKTKQSIIGIVVAKRDNSD